jgi:imidazolonepropionase-like amidohydrolase
MFRRIPAIAIFCFALLLIDPAKSAKRSVPSQDVVETGVYWLHKFEQPIGQETYTITREGNSVAMESKFGFTDRGTRVSLTATLQTRADLQPVHFEIKGKTSRLSDIDTTIDVSGGAAVIHEGEKSRKISAGDRVFTIGGYAPVAAQMMLFRYWNAHGRATPLKTLPSGEVTIDRRGRDVFHLGRIQRQLERYSVRGLIWGREWFWADSENELVALVSDDAEFDHFEAVRDGYEGALPELVAAAAMDGLEDLQSRAAADPGQGKVVVIAGATLISATGQPAAPDSVVVIERGRITAAGRRSTVTIPPGAVVIDAAGKTVLPGLWDMHAHFEQVEWGPIYLAAGVTTVRDCGNELDFITAVRDMTNSGRGSGPRLLLAGIIDGESASALGTVRADSAEEARKAVARYKAAGFQQIKIYSSVNPDIVPIITAEAHRLGMTVTGHVPTGMDARKGVEAGMDQINHIEYVATAIQPRKSTSRGESPPPIDPSTPEAAEVIQFLKNHGTVIDPTLVIYEIEAHPRDTPVSSFEPGINKVAPELLGPLENTGVPAARAHAAGAYFNSLVSLVGALHRAGVPIVAGTDQTVPGHSLHREIELYVRAGFTPMEAIQAATIVPARAMKLDGESGTLEVGKRADLIIVDGNPLDDIRNIRKVRTVIANGRVLQCARLWESVGFKP